MKLFIKRLLRLLPDSLAMRLVGKYREAREGVVLRRAFRYDRRVFARESGVFRVRDRRASLEAVLIKGYHRIEKGLALGQPRAGFGRDAIDALLDDGRYYVRRYGSDLTVRRVINVLEQYHRFNAALGVDLQWLLPRLADLTTLARVAPPNAEGGTREVSAAEIRAAGRVDFARFVEYRFSVRQFSATPVTDQQIEQAVRQAKRSPSVCNRESGHVFVASSIELKARVLALQNGNRGFGEQASKVLVVTSSIETFLNAGERYQCWIDGGLFAMSLIYALHAQGLGTCCLNWSVEPEVDLALKRSVAIPAGHAVIMLLAVGNLPDVFRVAQSPRRPLAEVLHYL